MKQPAEDVVAIARRVVAGPSTWVDHTTPHGEADVWRLMRDGRTLAWVKQHRTLRKWQQEVHAYRTWLPHVGDGVADLLEADEASRTLVLAHVAGTPADARTGAASSWLFA